MAEELTPDMIRSELAATGRQRAKSDRTRERAGSRARELAPLARAAGITIVEIAQLAGVTRQTVHQWLNAEAGPVEEDT